MNKVLVTGGAGYIGSFMTKRLIDSGYDVVVVDNLSRGYRDAIDNRAAFVIGDLLDKEFVEKLFHEQQFGTVIHFAGYISMRESMENPGIYFQNNTFGALNILEQMRKNNVSNFIFSSTAGVYGNPIKLPIPEDHPKNPTNPYGESKLMVEQVLRWYQKVFGINFVALRYFNAAGASLDGNMGENHKPETHIIPNAINSVLENSEFILYGNDYNTPDKTCIRDYIHIIDLVGAHILALNKLQKDKGGFIYNVGTGIGHSNKEIIEMVKKVCGFDFKVKIEGRREGDADMLVADPLKIKNELGFQPRYSGLETIIRTAWEWHKKNQKSKIKNQK